MCTDKHTLKENRHIEITSEATEVSYKRQTEVIKNAYLTLTASENSASMFKKQAQPGKSFHHFEM